MSGMTDRMRKIAKQPNKHHLEYPDTFNPRTVLAMLDVIDAADRLTQDGAWSSTARDLEALDAALVRFREVSS